MTHHDTVSYDIQKYIVRSSNSPCHISFGFRTSLDQLQLGPRRPRNSFRACNCCGCAWTPRRAPQRRATWGATRPQERHWPLGATGQCCSWGSLQPQHATVGHQKMVKPWFLWPFSSFHVMSCIWSWLYVIKKMALISHSIFRLHPKYPSGVMALFRWTPRPSLTATSSLRQAWCCAVADRWISGMPQRPPIDFLKL